MASCFPCTTYMYAGRFPPSSMHLGRGESWVPPANHYINGEDKPMPAYDETTVDTVRKQWNADIFAYLTLGTSYLLAALSKQKQPDEMYICPSHIPSLRGLDERLRAKANNQEWISYHGGNLFLDALTVHESDWKRIKSMLAPICQRMEQQAASLLSQSGKSTG